MRRKNKEQSTGFKATNSWCHRFMRRNKLVMRQKTKIAQKLPDDLDDKVVDFHTYVINLRKKHGYELSQIINMDETPMFFDMLGNSTVNKSGERTVFVKTTGHEKQHFTVVLACCADGSKLKPLVIIKRKTMPKVKFPSGVFVHVHPKGWMYEQGTRLCIHAATRRASSEEKFACVGYVSSPLGGSREVGSEIRTRGHRLHPWGIDIAFTATRCVHEQAFQRCYTLTVERVDGLGRKVANPER